MSTTLNGRERKSIKNAGTQPGSIISAPALRVGFALQTGPQIEKNAFMEAVCALCQMNGDLQNSHIIPEFFYKLLYDPNPRRFRVISAIVSEPERYEQKGLRRGCYAKIANRNWVGGRTAQNNPLLMDGHSKSTSRTMRWFSAVSTTNFSAVPALSALANERQ